MYTQKNKLILCTCELGDEYPEEYWILHRFNKDKTLCALGLPFMPLEGFELLQYNNMLSWIMKTLNKHNSFDKEIVLKKGDVLSLRLKDFEDSFEFKYNGKIWVKYRNKNSFELINNYDEIQQGIVKSDLSAFLK